MSNILPFRPHPDAPILQLVSASERFAGAVDALKRRDWDAFDRIMDKRAYSNSNEDTAA